MAFTFVVETGTGDSEANSYTTVEFADDYVETNHFASAAWLALEDEEKERLLVRASKYLDNIMTWEADRVYEESGLRWPRSGVIDQDGYEIADDTIPIILQEAVAEFASTYLISDDWTQPAGTFGLKELQVDVIDLKFDANMSRGSIPDYIIQMLDGLGSANKGTRPAFKKIIRS